MVAIAGNITESLAVTDWRVSAHKCSDGSLSGTTTTTGTTYSITCADADICNVTIAPVVDKNWGAGVSAPLNSFFVPSSPDTTPRLYKVTASPDGDSNYNSTVLSLHCDGADASTTFTDTSFNPSTITANGNAQIKTAQSKFGGASAFFDGAGDYLSAPSNTKFSVGSNDFTVRMFLRPDPAGVRRFVCGRSDSGASTFSLFLEITAANVLKVYFDNTRIITGTTTLTASTWCHVEFCRVGGTGYLFLNGASEGTVAITGAISDYASIFSIGRLGLYDGLYYLGHIDDFQIYNGVGLHTTTFTPPTSTFLDNGPATTSSTEPTWPTSGTVDETVATGTVTYTYIADLDDGMFKTLGVKVPV